MKSADIQNLLAARGIEAVPTIGGRGCSVLHLTDPSQGRTASRALGRAGLVATVSPEGTMTVASREDAAAEPKGLVGQMVAEWQRYVASSTDGGFRKASPMQALLRVKRLTQKLRAKARENTPLHRAAVRLEEAVKSNDPKKIMAAFDAIIPKRVVNRPRILKATANLQEHAAKTITDYANTNVLRPSQVESLGSLGGSLYESWKSGHPGVAEVQLRKAWSAGAQQVSAEMRAEEEKASPLYGGEEDGRSMVYVPAKAGGPRERIVSAGNASDHVLGSPRRRRLAADPLLRLTELLIERHSGRRHPDEIGDGHIKTFLKEKGCADKFAGVKRMLKSLTDDGIPQRGEASRRPRDLR